MSYFAKKIHLLKNTLSLDNKLNKMFHQSQLCSKLRYKYYNREAKSYSNISSLQLSRFLVFRKTKDDSLKFEAKNS